MTSADARLDALARDDKWYLSCGDGVVWAPPFPVWLHRPGFWDEAHVHHHAFSPLFSVALVDRRGREIPLVPVARLWWPDRLELLWHVPGRAEVREIRYALPGGVLVSAWEVAPGGAPAFAGSHLVAYTIQPGPDVAAIEPTPSGGLQWRRRVVDRKGHPLDVTARLEVDGREASAVETRRAALRSEGTVAHPIWAHTPFGESWLEGTGLRDGVRLAGISPSGLVHAAIDLPLPHGPEAPVAVAMRLEAEGTPAPPSMDPRAWMETDPREPWREWLASYPAFSCSDPFLERCYDYRLYGLRLNRLAGGVPNQPHTAIAEGVGYFHVPIAYSAPCHMLETRWSRDPDAARGSLLNFLACQRPDGSLHGRIYRQLEGTDFYHANWGDACLAVDALHPDADFLRQAYDGLARYARWLDHTRDREQSGMYDIVDQYETGQEFMSRYLAVDPGADRYGWENRIRLKGIDVTVYAWLLKQALGGIALRLGRATDAAMWQEGAGRTGRALLGRMWDEATGFFGDVNPKTMWPTGVKAAVGFYPLLTDVVDEAHVRRLAAHLADPAEFATPFPLPSSSLDDHEFSAEAEWKGKRHACPWNGRAWPMTTSHVVEGLLRQYRRGHRELGALAADMLARFVRMLFHEGDLGRPNCHEHYNPLTGQACVYRGIDDYMHSWVIDLIIRGVAGVEPSAAALRVDPLPMAIEEAHLTGLRVRGRRVEVRRAGGQVRVDVDGTTHEARVGEPLGIGW